MMKAIHREFPLARNAAFGAALVGLAFVASPRTASASEEMTALAPAQIAEAQLADAPTAVPRGTMLPIPDDPVPALAQASAGESQDEKECLATAVYFEARGESTKGQKAVAEVIVTRARTPGRPQTICGVVYEGSDRRTGCQFSFTCDRIADVVRDQDAWERAEKIAATVMRTRAKGRTVARGATYFHASNVRPRWARHMVQVAQIGTHYFYRP